MLYRALCMLSKRASESIGSIDEAAGWGFLDVTSNVSELLQALGSAWIYNRGQFGAKSLKLTIKAGLTKAAIVERVYPSGLPQMIYGTTAIVWRATGSSPRF